MYHNEQINQSLEQLTATLENLSSLSSNTSALDVKSLLKQLTREMPPLKKALESNPGLHYEYEFYEEGALCVAKISGLRIDPQLKPLLKQWDFWAVLNPLVDMIAKAVFLHESLKAYVDILQKLKPLDTLSLEELRDYVAHVNKAVAKIRSVADKGVEKTEQVNQELEKAKKRSGEFLPDKLLQKTMTVTLTMYAKSAAAMIATDRQITVEDALLERQESERAD